jgi:hypothetical protein
VGTPGLGMGKGRGVTRSRNRSPSDTQSGRPGRRPTCASGNRSRVTATWLSRFRLSLSVH